ncbi:MAG: ADP-ribosylglycohydrolase family protein [Kofleriaceae bacterium]|nr:ADP-ribosylglycohydrolase family protein [Kofleriaceae bacterium]
MARRSCAGTRRASTGVVDHLTGLLLGTAVGDSLGLPREGLHPRRAAALFPGPLRQRLLLGRGMLSDDTEHACMTAQALLAAGDDPRRFARVLAWKLRWWLLGLPAAVGWGTLRAIARSWVGFSPRRSGVWSAGNGAAMRAPIIGAWVQDLDQIGRFVEASTLLTHRDPRALAGAVAVAIAAHHAVHAAPVAPARVLRDIRRHVADPELLTAVDQVEAALDGDHTPARLAGTLGLADGVTGYMLHTVPVCLHAWLRSPTDFRRVVGDVIALGGDADTTGAIAGALAGATVGASGIPPEWLAISDWPRSLASIRALGARLSQRGRPLPFWWPAIPLRNAAFTAVVLATGVRRLLPPY